MASPTLTHPPIFPKSYEESYLTTIPLSTAVLIKQPTALMKQSEAEKKLQRQRAAYSASFSLLKGQLSGLLSSFFMLYMTANSLQIFPLIMLAMAVLTPIRSILSINSTFSRYESIGTTCFIPKALYLILNLICVMAVLWKCNRMNLIPLEWIDYDPYLWAHQPFSPQAGKLAAFRHLVIDRIAAVFR